MPANNYISDILTTELNTPDVAEWLLGQLARLRDAASERSTTRDQCRAAHAALTRKLTFYREHRRRDDPHRSSGHSGLVSQTKSAVHVMYDQLSRLAGTSSPLLAHPFPYTTGEMEGAVNEAIAANRWTCECHDCGRLTTDCQIADGSYNLCARCFDRSTAHCQCAGHPRRRSVRLSNIRSPAPSSDILRYCPDCQPATQFVCQRCGHRAAGTPVHPPSVPEGTPPEMYGLLQCHVCAELEMQQCGCGRYVTSLDHRRPTAPAVQHMEDDDRVELNRDDDDDDDSEYCCTQCYNELSGQSSPQYWDAAESNLLGSTFNEVRSKRKFGVELEVCHAAGMRDMPSSQRRFWHAKRDGSLPSSGVEMASSIFQGDEGLQAIKDLCHFANNHRWAVDRRAGFHLHVDLGRETQAQVAAVGIGYLATHRLWSCFVAHSRVKNQYCIPIRIPGKLENFIKNTPDQIIAQLRGGSRYQWVNWAAYSKFKTVEIRFHQGTLDYVRIANWIKAHTRFVDWCCEQGTPQAVFDAFNKNRNSCRNTFLFLSQVIWKDRPLGRWFRNRAYVLKHGKDVLPLPNRKLRKEGIDPTQFAEAINGQQAAAPVAAAVNPF